MNYRNSCYACLVCLVALFAVNMTVQAAPLEILDVSVQGSTLIPEKTILAQISSRAGGFYKPDVAAADIQNIYALGMFSKIDVAMENVDGKIRLIFQLKEHPLISKIELKGNKKVKREEIEEVLTLRPADITDPFKLKFYPSKIHEDAKAIKQLYEKKGFYNAKITPAIVPDPGAPQDKVLIQYTIEEQKKVTVRGIDFKGNTTFSAKELRKTMATRKKWFFSFITGSGKYEKSEFDIDLERVKFFYADHGYLDVQVVDSKLDFKNDNSDLYITITLQEGEVYTIKDVGIAGNTILATPDIRKAIKVAPGEPISRTKIYDDRRAIADLYAPKGYVTPISENTDGKLLIDPKIDIEKEKREVSLIYEIREGVPHILNRLTIVGNERTHDKIIRREVKLAEGDLFDQTKIAKSQQRVFNLGFFEDVNVDFADGAEPNTVDMTMKLAERSGLGSFHFGGGWGSLDKWMFSAGITHDNILGLAHQIEFSTTLSKKSQLFDLSYTIPYFLDSNYLLGIDAYNTKREYEAYDSRSIGGGFRFGRNITDNMSGTFKYGYEAIKINNVDEDASSVIKKEEGSSTTSSLSLLLRRTTLNNVRLPTKGFLTRLNAEVAGGILQGDNNFYKITLNNQWYIPLIKDWAFLVKSEIAYAKPYGDTEEVPLFERFFAGGQDTLRGHKDRMVGPKDENDDPIGGNKRALFSTELIIPIKKQFQLLTFFDSGNVYGQDENFELSKFRKSVGVGLRVSTPMGQLKFDWGYKLDKKDGESNDEFHFGMGGLF